MPAIADITTRPEEHFLTAFTQQAGPASNGSSVGLQRLRQEAMARFTALGFPARKAEAWKYTPISKRLQRPYPVLRGPVETPVTRQELAAFLLPGLDAHLAVFVNGRFSDALSTLSDLPDGVIVTGLARAGTAHPSLLETHLARYADYQEAAFTALNTAFMQDGVFVYVPRHTVVEKPIHVLSLITGPERAMLQPRHLLVAEENTHLTLVATSEAHPESETFINTVTEAFVGAHAHVDLYTIQHEHRQTSVVNTLHAYQQRNSVFRSSTFTFGGDIIRNNATLLPDGEGCESHLYGLFLADGTMHVDNHTVVDHAQPNCYSNELYKGILDDRATGVFNGRVLVRLDAQQTNAYQSNKSILLTETASMYSKPELEIYADDVKCSHGATTGQLDEDALFYLRSRGLTEHRARALLLTAFARDVLDNVKPEPVRDYLDTLIDARFST